MMLTRRGALLVLAAPAIVRAASLMPVRALAPSWILYLGGTEFYVDPNSISLPGEQLGTLNKPWRQVQQAVDYLNARGIGEEQVTINILTMRR